MESPATPDRTLDIRGILEKLPHRFPAVMVDRVLDYEPKKWLECIKGVTIDEPFFRGHFPDIPVFPGVLQIEAAAQASALLVLLSEPMDSILVFGQVKRFTFLKPVVPGDLLKIRVDSLSFQGEQGLAEATLSVKDEVVARGTLAYGSMPKG